MSPSSDHPLTRLHVLVSAELGDEEEQHEAVFARRVAEVPVPAGEFEFLPLEESAPAKRATSQAREGVSPALS